MKWIHLQFCSVAKNIYNYPARLITYHDTTTVHSQCSAHLLYVILFNVALFIRSSNSNSPKILLTKSYCSDLQIYNIFINISISSFSAKIYILYIKIKNKNKIINTRIGIRNIRRHSHGRLFFLYAIEMYLSSLKQFEFCTQAA